MKKLFFVIASLLLSFTIQAQDMKGRIYFNGNMSVTHLLGEKDSETPEQREERVTVMNEIFTMTVTIEFINSHDMRMKMKILMDKERAKELGSKPSSTIISHAILSAMVSSPLRTTDQK